MSDMRPSKENCTHAADAVEFIDGLMSDVVLGRELSRRQLKRYSAGINHLREFCCVARVKLPPDAAFNRHARQRHS